MADECSATGEQTPIELPPEHARDSVYALRIVSFRHAHGPFRPPTSCSDFMQFSVQDISNPPPRLRKSHIGLSLRLRKEVMGSKQARIKLAGITAETEQMMDHMEQHSTDQGTRENLSNETGRRRLPLLVIAIMCEEGKHRSVSFAEELSRRLKRKGWDLEVRNRDLRVSLKHEIGGDEEEDVGSPIQPRKTAKQCDQERKTGRSAGRGFIQDDD